LGVLKHLKTLSKNKIIYTVIYQIPLGFNRLYGWTPLGDLSSVQAESWGCTMIFWHVANMISVPKALNQWIGLGENFNRKTPYLMVKTHGFL